MTAAIAEPNLPAVQQPKAQLVAGANIAPIIPRTIDEVARVARAVIVAGLAPDSYKGKNDEETASKIMVGIMKGAEVGAAPFTALANIAIINGRPSIWGDLAIALVQARGIVTNVEAKYEGEESGKAEPQITDFLDSMTAVYRIWRKGQTDPYEGRFSVRDAKRAHLWGKKQPWVQYPKRMLMARARAYALRDGFADCLSGLSIREEIEDLPPEAPAKTDTAFLENEAPKLAAPIETVEAETVKPDDGDRRPAPEAAPLDKATESLLKRAREMAGQGKQAFDTWAAKATPKDKAILEAHKAELTAITIQADAGAGA